MKSTTNKNNSMFADLKSKHSKDKDLREDYIIVSAVFIQPILVLLQQIMIYVFYIPAESTTIYRVFFTAVPMSIAISLSAIRKPFLFVSSYLLVICMLLFTLLLFPANTDYLISGSTRFLLPVVIPSALCLMSVKNPDIIEKIMYYCSVVVAFEVLFIAFYFFKGQVFINRYNMAFSYGCLMPMTVLYSGKNVYGKLLSIFLFIVVLGIGSRGASVFFALYVIGNMLMNDKKKAIWAVFFIILFILLLPLISDMFSSLGINSRTLRRLDEGTISESEGRDWVWNYYTNMLWNHPITGIGLYGDRVYIDTAYCHNILLEVLLDFGLIGGGLIIVFLFYKWSKLYLVSSRQQQHRIWLYLMAFVAPLMLSESYLQTNSFFVAIGLIHNLEKENRSQRYSHIKLTH